MTAGRALQHPWVAGETASRNAVLGTPKLLEAMRLNHTYGSPTAYLRPGAAAEVAHLVSPRIGSSASQAVVAADASAATVPVVPPEQFAGLNAGVSSSEAAAASALGGAAAGSGRGGAGGGGVGVGAALWGAIRAGFSGSYVAGEGADAIGVSPLTLDRGRPS